MQKLEVEFAENREPLSDYRHFVCEAASIGRELAEKLGEEAPTVRALDLFLYFKGKERAEEKRNRKLAAADAVGDNAA